MKTRRGRTPRRPRRARRTDGRRKAIAINCLALIMLVTGYGLHLEAVIALGYAVHATHEIFDLFRHA